MAELRKLEIIYSKNYHTAFEDLSTLIFCTYLGLQQGVNRRINQKGIESDPVTIGNKKYAYQAKYYEAATRLRDKKFDFINSIETARQKGVTHLLFFINKDLPDTINQTREESKYLKEINKVAEGSDKETSVVIDWWTLSRIESCLDMPKYKHIQQIYLCNKEIDTKGYSLFYDYIYKQFSSESENELFGNVSLLDFYIEPTVNEKDAKGYNKTVRVFLESWIEQNESIAVICGEPGHGKTSLCWKAMCDFYKKGWLSGKVSNVFCFSLNPSNTEALANDSFYLYRLLSWGDDRESPEQRIKKEECQNALIFFDGFDELLEWHPRFNLKNFIEEYIISFQRNTGARIIITSRKMAVNPISEVYEFANRIRVPIKELQLISKDQQIRWIERYIDHYHKRLSAQLEHSAQYPIKYSEDEYLALVQYLEKYKQVIADGNLRELLGVPIIFRMIVMAQYLPQKGQSITQIYDNLFHATWVRHRHKRKNTLLTPELDDRAQLSRHALKIYMDNNDTAVVDNLLESPWLFSFYTTIKGEKRVGFMHRSFYQYFLALEIVSWFMSYVSNKDESAFRSKLSMLARRRVDKATLFYIGDLFNEGHKKLTDISFQKVYEILKVTDGFFINYQDITQGREEPRIFEKNYKQGPLERANNVFWNIVSICGICGKSLLHDKINMRTLRLYDLSGCILKNACLVKANLTKAHLTKADLSKANLNQANLEGADLKETDLCGSNLKEAYLYGADLRFANLSRANLSRSNPICANFSGANLYCSDLNEATLSGADLSYANLRKANLKNADLRGVNLSGADLSFADLSGADFTEAFLYQTNLSNSNLSGAVLSWAILSESELNGAELGGAILIGTDLKEADLSEVNLSGAFFSDADFERANLCDADFSEAIIDKKDIQEIIN